MTERRLPATAPVVGPAGIAPEPRPVDNVRPRIASPPASSAQRARADRTNVFLLAMLLCMAWPAFAASGRDASPLFQSEAALAVTLDAPWNQVLRKSGQPPVRHAAVLSYTDAQGVLRRIDATIETRGLTRLRVCRFPPLRIRFAGAATRGTIFEGQRSLKMVSHCQEGHVHERYYVQEMLAYRIYNLLTGHSFRVRPLDITYRDPAGGRPYGPRFAFLVEDLRDVARRGGHKVAGEAEFAPGDFDARDLTRFMLFQYMLGNTDWDVLGGPSPDACCHNARVVGSEDPRTRIAVPYDFDSSGVIDASYAAPHPRLRIKSVTERLYRGFCVHNDALEPVRQEFLAHRPAIQALVGNESRLSQQGKRAMTNYLDAFYAVLGNESRFAREISAKCRK